MRRVMQVSEAWSCRKDRDGGRSGVGWGEGKNGEEVRLEWGGVGDG